MAYKAVLFDFNGVILWDRLWHEEAWDDLSELIRGKKMTPEENEHHVHGRTTGETLEFLLGRKPEDNETDQLLARKEKLYQEVCLRHEEFQLSPGAEQLFNLIHDLGLKQTIATSSPLMNIDFYYEHLGLDEWFPRDQVVYDDRTFPGKPAPDVYLRAASKLGVDIGDCIVVEDAKSGVLSAMSAKAGKIIAVVHEGNMAALEGLEIGKFVKNLGEITPGDLA